MASVRWTIAARGDLRAVVEYISRDSPTYAAATAERILSAAGRLRLHPRLGRVVPEFEDDSIRELIVGNHRVVYTVRGERIGIVAVVHASREVLRRLKQASWNIE